MPTIFDRLTWAKNILSRAGITGPDAEWALAHVLSSTRAELHLHAREPISETQDRIFRNLIARRVQRVPLQHLLGETEFFGLSFQCTPDALIPRPETEILVEVLIGHLRNHPAPRILDLGTGSGIIAVALSSLLPRAHLVAADLSGPALHLARRNAHRNRVADRMAFVRADLLSAFATGIRFDAIASNPPYIPTAHLETLDPEVRNHDPHLSLDGGPDGLTFYRRIIPAAVSHLAPGGLLAFEIGCDQAGALAGLLAQQPALTAAAIHPDLSGHPRVATAVRTPSLSFDNPAPFC